MCLVQGCTETHNFHVCRSCGDTNSKHFTRNCPYPANMAQSWGPQFTMGHQVGRLFHQVPQPSHCRVKGCNERHQAHYCKECHSNDSDHFAKNCPKMNHKGGNYNHPMYNGNHKPHTMQRHGPQDHGDIIGHRQDIVRGFEVNTKGYDMFNRHYEKKRTNCLVKACKQNHERHYCKICHNNNSDHFASDCPNTHQRHRKMSPEKFDHNRRSRSKELKDQRPFQRKNSSTPKSAFTINSKEEGIGLGEDNIYMAGGGKRNGDYLGIGRGKSPLQIDHREGSLEEAPWAKMMKSKGYAA